MGARFRLKSSFDISAYPPAAKVILRALQQYGMFLADVGSEGHITLSSDVTENPAIVSVINSLGGQISYTNLEAVDESSLVASQNSNRVNPSNPYVRPANYASLTIMDATNPANRVVVPIVIQPVMIGTPDPAIVVQAGTPAFNVPYWVTGASNGGVTWSISPATGAGVISSTGAYTAPTSISGLTQAAIITATSVQDPSASTSIALTLIPAGQIRIDSGSAFATVDDSGKPWLPDLGFETGSYSTTNDIYGSNGEYDHMPNALIWATSSHTWGDDIVYRFHVPNGNYKVTVMNAFPNGSGTYDPTYTFDNGLDLGPLNIWGQQQIGAHNLDFGMLTNHQARTPASVDLPATVKDTTLTIALRVITNQYGHSIPFINGLVITPDTSAPHIAIDTQAQTTVPAGGSLQLYLVSWYSSDVSAYWKVTKGSGTMNGALYVAPSNVPSTQINTVSATGYSTYKSAFVNVSVPSSGTSTSNGIAGKGGQTH